MHPIRAYNKAILWTDLLVCRIWKHLPLIGKRFAKVEAKILADPKRYIRRRWTRVFVQMAFFGVLNVFLKNAFKEDEETEQSELSVVES